jgi:hypothetical protein
VFGVRVHTIPGRPDPQTGRGENIMGTFTIGHGFGMLAVGLMVILIGGLIVWKMINHKPKEQKYGK